ncbi:unnamed protein product, partial [Mesocestoides corti]
MSLSSLKAYLWTLASKEPFYECLGPPSDYVLQGISALTAEGEYFYNENCTFSGLQLMLPLMRLEKVADDSQTIEQNKQNAMIAKISTISQADLNAAAEARSEVAWTRQRLLSMADANVTRLNAGGPVAVAHYLTAAAQQPKLTTSLQRCLRHIPHLTISAICVDCSDPPQQHLLALNLPKEVTVASAIKEIVDAQTRLVKGEVGCHDLDPASKYLLKVCCSQEYLFDPESALIHYMYVQECLEKGEIPRLTPVLLEDVLDCLGLPPLETPGTTEYRPATTLTHLPSVIELHGEGDVEATTDVWDLRDYFSLTVRSAQKSAVGVDAPTRVT